MGMVNSPHKKTFASIVINLVAITSLSGLGNRFATAENETNHARPNIVYIMADDMGLGDVKCFGKDKSKAETPNIDTLSRDGMMFTDAHAPVAHCIPTRIAIMTGRYAFRFKPPTPSGPWGFLNPRFAKTQHTIGSMLQSVGYHTGYVGKWHLGVTMQTTDGKNQGPKNVDYTKPLAQGPNDHGFDDSFILPGSLDMFPYVFAKNHHWVGPVNSKKGWSAFNRIGPAADDFEDYKVLDTFSTEAESFLADRAKARTDGESEPFFLYFSLTAPHTPTSPSPKFRGKSKLGLYGDFLMETDDCVGRILKALDRHKLAENTLVVFTSDHGAAAYAGNIAKATANQFEIMQALGHFSSGIYRGFKFSAYEGGTRIPLIVRWPNKIKPASQCRSVVGLHDMMATFAEVADVRLDERHAPDSFSFVNTLTNPAKNAERESLICRSTNHFTIRKGDWKLLLCPGSGCGGNYGNSPRRNDAWKDAVKQFGRSPKRSEIRQAPFCQLFNLKNDPTESKNLAAEHQAKVNELSAILDSAMANGRTTPGKKLKNDRQFNPSNDVPKFVWEK
jgi:arylsulfatase A-like enzyme